MLLWFLKKNLLVIAMMLSLTILICGKSLYTHKPKIENMFIKVCSCILVSDVYFYLGVLPVEQKKSVEKNVPA